jgi:drug/metabolite transporter (DMT)-like permease
MATQSYQRGVLYVVLAGVFLSFGGLLVRYVEAANPWTILFYRSITFTISVLVFMWCRDRTSFKTQLISIKPVDLLISLFLALGFIFYILSLFNTTVANTVLVLCIGPVLAAVLAYFILKEKVNPITWFAMLLAALGVLVMVYGGIKLGDIKGIAYAGVAVVSFAALAVTLRYLGPRTDAMAPTALAGVMAAGMCVPAVMSLQMGFQINLNDLLLAVCMGSVQVGAGFILITLGSRSVPAAQIPLLALAETGLSPLWVWLAINEIPDRNTIIGGAIVLVAVLCQGVTALRKQQN